MKSRLSKPASRAAPWRIGTLKYLEMKIEKWPSRVKWGQAGAYGAKWCQTGSNKAKRGQTGQKGPYGAKCGQKGPNEAKWDHMWLIFYMHEYFYVIKKIMFSKPGTKTKIGRAIGIFLIPRFWSGSTKTVVEVLVLVRGNCFFISSETLFDWLYFKLWP